MIAEEATIRDLAAAHPAAASVFEKYGIDYCCGGLRPLGDVCREKGLAATTIVDEIERRTATAAERQWSEATLAELVDHIVGTHHAYLKEELPRLESRMRKVVSVHGERHGESLHPLSQAFFGLKAELDGHMMKEEQILFPFIVEIEEHRTAGKGPLMAPFGTVANPIHAMEWEHDSAGQALATMSRVTSNYTPPEDACTTYRALLEGLAVLERDLHQHIHLENNILFPRAIALEA